MRPSDVMTWILAAHAVLAVALGARVMLMRMGKNIPVGDGDDKEMRRAVRAYGNFAEWVPLVLLVLLVADLRGCSPLVIGALGGTLLAGRVAHGVAMSRTTGASTLRTAGVTMTLAALILGVVATLVGGS